MLQAQQLLALALALEQGALRLSAAAEGLLCRQRGRPAAAASLPLSQLPAGRSCCPLLLRLRLCLRLQLRRQVLGLLTQLWQQLLQLLCVPVEAASTPSPQMQR